MHIALQKIIGHRPHVAKIAEEIGHAMANRRGRDVFIAGGNRLEHGLVDLVIDGEHRPVVRLERVVRVVRGTAAQGGQRQQRQKSRGLFHLLSPAPLDAALL